MQCIQMQCIQKAGPEGDTDEDGNLIDRRVYLNSYFIAESVRFL